MEQKETEAKFPYNPAHAIGTCGYCGGEMRYNVPRLGPNGGFIHAESGQLECGPQVLPKFTFSNTPT